MTLLAAQAALPAEPSRRVFDVQGTTISELLPSDYETGAGCSAYVPTDAASGGALVAFWGDEARIILRLDGKTVSMPAHGDYLFSSLRLGEASSGRFGNGRVTVRIKLTSVWVCPANDDSCEVTRYTGTLSIRIADIEHTVKIRAECGT